MNVVFIGDSMTSGENNGCKSYAHYFQEMNKDYNVTILGVSGSCFGNYSIYPVESTLYTMIDKNEDILYKADLIVIEFGVNDAAAVSLGYVDLLKVYISINRAVDYIKQISSAKLLFILAVNPDSIQFTDYLFKYTTYLNTEYLLNGINCKLLDLDNAYRSIYVFIKQNFSLITMDKDLYNNLDVDNIHPNGEGYRAFAERLTKYINEY